MPIRRPSFSLHARFLQSELYINLPLLPVSREVWTCCGLRHSPQLSSKKCSPSTSLVDQKKSFPADFLLLFLLPLPPGKLIWAFKSHLRLRPLSTVCNRQFVRGRLQTSDSPFSSPSTFIFPREFRDLPRKHSPESSCFLLVPSSS